MSAIEDFNKRLGQLDKELIEAARSGDARAQVRLHYARAAAWHAFADIQREYGRDHIPSLGAAARDEAAAERLSSPALADGGHGLNNNYTVSAIAVISAVIGFWILPILFGPLAMLVGAVGMSPSYTPNRRFGAGTAMVIGLLETAVSGYQIARAVGVIQ